MTLCSCPLKLLQIVRDDRGFSRTHTRDLSLSIGSPDRLDTGACLNRSFLRSSYTIKSYAFAMRIFVTCIQNVPSVSLKRSLDRCHVRSTHFITVLLREKKRKIKEKRESLIKNPDLRGSRCQ